MDKFFFWEVLHLLQKKPKHSEYKEIQEIQISESTCISNLIHIILIITETKIDVGINTSEFYGSSIIGSGYHNQTNTTCLDAIREALINEKKII